MSNGVDLDAIIAAETERTVMTKEDRSSAGIWLPKSPVEVDGEVRDPGIVAVPESLAIERGLI